VVAVVVMLRAAADGAAVAAGAESDPGVRNMTSLLASIRCAIGATVVAAGLVLSAPVGVLAQDQVDEAAAASPADETEAAEEPAGGPIDLSSLAAVDEPPAFDNPGQVVEAFKAALAANDLAALANLLGLDVEKLRADENTASTFAELRELAANQVVAQDLGGDRQMLGLGPKLWPFPFPIVKGEDGKWAFDTFDGLEEIVNRRVGENELEAIKTVRAYVDAQREYADSDRDGDGVLEFAQKLISSEGQTDGLYWPADQGDGESPVGDFADQAALDKAKQGEGYFGYRFRILTGQGDEIDGGAYDYVINGNMIAGFALIAWPVKYEETGVKTFVVSHHGTIYEADLGPATEAIVKYIERFNPGDDWQVVGDGT
jgi:hypothetical protein